MILTKVSFNLRVITVLRGPFLLKRIQPEIKVKQLIVDETPFGIGVTLTERLIKLPFVVDVYPCPSRERFGVVVRKGSDTSELFTNQKKLIEYVKTYHFDERGINRA